MNNRPTYEFQTMEELKSYFLNRVSFLLGQIEERKNEFDIEASVYAMKLLVESVHAKMRRMNSSHPV